MRLDGDTHVSHDRTDLRRQSIVTAVRLIGDQLVDSVLALASSRRNHSYPQFRSSLQLYSRRRDAITHTFATRNNILLY